MITRDIKADLIAKLSLIESLIKSGNSNEACLQLADVMDSVSSSMVTVTYSRPAAMSRPGDCTNAEELVARNID